MVVRSEHLCLSELEKEFDEDNLRINVVKQTKSIMVTDTDAKTTTTKTIKSEIKVSFREPKKELVVDVKPSQHPPPVMSPRTGRIMPHFKEPTSAMIRNKSLLNCDSLAFIDRLMTENQSFCNLLDLCEQPEELEDSRGSMGDAETGSSSELPPRKH